MNPSNITFANNDDECFEIKIKEIGMTQDFDRKTGQENFVISQPLYMAPELVRHENYSEKIDVWSLGCITYQLLSGQTLFNGNNQKEINRNICTQKIASNDFKIQEFDAISQRAKDFITQCLDRDQNERPSISELLDHPWICDEPDKHDHGCEEQ